MVSLVYSPSNFNLWSVQCQLASLWSWHLEYGHSAGTYTHIAETKGKIIFTSLYDINS